jgi:prepilin-type processing-associated H-X9-DG protein
MYSDDFDNEYPSRIRPQWPFRLKPYYADERLLRCPTDLRTFERVVGTNSLAWSYLINGFNDWFKINLETNRYLDFLSYNYDHGLPEVAIRDSSETIVFAEKLTDNEQFHIDIDLGIGDHLIKVEHGRHMGGTGGFRSGGSNFAFADGSARYLRYGTSLAPLNLFAVTEAWRRISSALP